MFEFSGEEFKEFQEAINIAKFSKDAQEVWGEKGEIVRVAIAYLHLRADRFPMLRVVDEVLAVDHDIQQVRKDWEQIRSLVDFYFDATFEMLDTLQKMKEAQDGGKKTGE